MSSSLLVGGALAVASVVVRLLSGRALRAANAWHARLDRVARDAATAEREVAALGRRS